MAKVFWIAAASCFGVWIFWLLTEPLRRRSQLRRKDDSGSINSHDSGYRSDQDGNSEGGSDGGGGDGGGGGD